ncbi:cathelicidin-related antimicrobial peptide Bf-CRAMP-like isoform X2 [Dromiciops gliroides]|uniref:cathelicidin-related antimicrobial peptide Bf-CRAMP-like isoform X2 n=1 Tax=Dromiciops gliroides TaxID=33562 RepID=UPI001CC6A5F1|nr:cathelicidin-related antimicrobial peptide Bf-CRAMP-like isoform X2 [Dromiciops gliroides]
MMGPLGRSLLVLCVAMSITTLCAQQGERVSDREAVALLLDAYNRESHDDYIFGLLETKPASDQAGRRILSFTVQETKCLKSENQNLDQCEFKEGGVVKDCKGEVSSERHLPVVVVSCDSVDAQGAQAQEESNDDVSPPSVLTEGRLDEKGEPPISPARIRCRWKWFPPGIVCLF